MRVIANTMAITAFGLLSPPASAQLSRRRILSLGSIQQRYQEMGTPLSSAGVPGARRKKTSPPTVHRALT